MRYIFIFLISGFMVLSAAQTVDCQNLLGDSLLYCMQEQNIQAIEGLHQEIEQQKAELNAANQQISVLNAQLEQQITQMGLVQAHIAELEKGLRFYPHPQGVDEIQWERSAKSYIENISVGLEGTNAKYALAMGYGVHDGNSTAADPHQLGVHVFGYDLHPTTNNYWEHAGGTFLSAERGHYAAFVVNGETAGWDVYGQHAFLMIPLKDNQTMDVLLAAGTHGGTAKVLLRVFGYLE